MVRRTLKSPSVLIRKCSQRPPHSRNTAARNPSKARSANSSRFSAPGRWMPPRTLKYSHAPGSLWYAKERAENVSRQDQICSLFPNNGVRFCVSLCSGFLHAVVARDVKNKGERAFLQFSLRYGENLSGARERKTPFSRK
jgi:hypothetical protein